MARPVYSLGMNTFLGINGAREPLKMRLSLDERPGIKGTEITQEEQKGRPFTIRSWVDCISYAQARGFFSLYTAEIQTDPQELIVADISSLAEGYKVQVLDVREVHMGPITPGTNGINPPSLAILEVEWDLIAVPL